MKSFTHTELTMLDNSYEKTGFHKLNSSWNLWAHLPSEKDWSIKSYKKIYTFNYIEEVIAITELLPEIVKSCMLFIMKDGIAPMWEDPKNRNGGCFSYRIQNKQVFDVWKDITYTLVGESISSNAIFINNVNGITISPKKSFCILKIWMSNCECQNPKIITAEIKNLTSNGCLFKRHEPEF
jgi:hypothetical protein